MPSSPFLRELSSGSLSGPPGSCLHWEAKSTFFSNQSGLKVQRWRLDTCPGVLISLALPRCASSEESACTRNPLNAQPGHQVLAKTLRPRSNKVAIKRIERRWDTLPQVRCGFTVYVIWELELWLPCRLRAQYTSNKPGWGNWSLTASKCRNVYTCSEMESL